MKKKWTNSCRSSNEHTGNYLKKMKLFILLFFTGLITVSGATYSQQVKFNLTLEDATVKEIFKEIEEKSEFILFYNEDYVNISRRVSIDARNRNVEYILDEIFKGTDNTYKIYDRQIVILAPENKNVPEKKEEKSTQQETKDISGIVKSTEGSPVPGVTIIVKGTTNGAVTDTDGRYVIKNVPDGATLIYSFVGMKKQEVPVAGRSAIDVVLEDEAIGIGEVVAVGYGTQMKKELTGAVARVQSETLEKISAANFADALQGQVAGVNIQASSGEPGAATNIQIRGVGSFSSDALEPLYVVDGVPYESNPNISQSEIESIDILKDIASASIYGTRAANGVILITTKNGKSGKIQFEFNADYGLQRITSGISLVDNVEKLYIYETTYSVLNGDVNTDGSRVQWRVENNPTILDYNTDWQEFLANDYAPVSNYDFRLYGGKDNLTYNFTASYFDQEGVLTDNSDYNRFTARGNMDFKTDKFFGSVIFNGSYSEQQTVSGAVSHAAIRLSPTMRPVTTAEVITVEDGAESSDITNVSYFAKLLMQDDSRQIDATNLSVRFGYNLAKGLTLEGKAAGGLSHNFRKIYNPSVLVYTESGDLHGSSKPNADLTNWQLNHKRWMLEGILRYKWSTGQHNLNLLAVASAEKNTSSWFQGYGEEFLNNDILVLSGSASAPGVGGENSVNTLTGLLGRVQYNYNWKYLISASVRRDGSSRFGENNEYATFPSVSAGWNIHQENFFKQSSLNNFFDNMKLRYSFGSAGNQAIANYSYSTAVESKVDYIFYDASGEHLALGATQRGYANKDVKWETSVSHNIGLDLSMFNNKISFTADVYNVEKKDMLYPVQLPNSVGAGVGYNYETLIMNIGNMTNKGIELAGTYRKSGDFSFDATFTFTKNINEVTKTNLSTSTLYGGLPTAAYQNSDLTTIIREGYAVGTFFLVSTDGLINSQEELNEYRKIVPDAVMGDLKYIDYNNDKEIDDKDRVDQGSGAPEFEGGLTFNASYKSFDLNMIFYGSYGNKIFNGSKAYAYMVKTHKDLVYAYTADNPNATVPRLAEGLTHANVRTRSDYFLEDGSYFRLRNVQLGYSFPKKVIDRLNISQLRVYLGMQNLLTFTKYSGYDPEVGNDGLLNRGVDSGTYPVSATYRIGLNLKF